MGLTIQLEAERAKPPPPTQSGLHGDELDSIRVASESLRTDIMAQLEALSSGMREQANSSKSENERLEAQTRYLHTQVTTLQEQVCSRPNCVLINSWILPVPRSRRQKAHLEESCLRRRARSKSFEPSWNRKVLLAKRPKTGAERRMKLQNAFLRSYWTVE